MQVVVLFKTEWYSKPCDRIGQSITEWKDKHGVDIDIKHIDVEAEDGEVKISISCLSLIGCLSVYLSIELQDITTNILAVPTLKLYKARKEIPESPWGSTGLIGERIDEALQFLSKICQGQMNMEGILLSSRSILQFLDKPVFA